MNAQDAKRKSDAVEIRPATEADLTITHAYLQPFMEAQQILPRTETDLATLLPNGFLAIHDDKIVGFAAVEFYSQKLAELQCLTVDPLRRREGIGRRLVQHCVAHAKEKNVLELMAITASEELFRDCGFDYSLPGQKRALFIQTERRPTSDG